MTTEEKILALLEALASQSSGRGQEMEKYLESVYQRYRERNPEHASSREENA
jgi:hypothetical protein